MKVLPVPDDYHGLTANLSTAVVLARLKGLYGVEITAADLLMDENGDCTHGGRVYLKDGTPLPVQLRHQSERTVLERMHYREWLQSCCPLPVHDPQRHTDLHCCAIWRSPFFFNRNSVLLHPGRINH